MAAKRKPLWQVLAAQLLLISVPLYGSLPELSSVAAATRELVDESELGIGRDSAPANDDALGLFIACALVAPPERERATTRAVLRTRGPAKTRLRVDDYGRENQPQAALWFACEIAVAQPVFDNRLTRVTLANGTVVEHAYDSDGTRIRTTTTPLGGPAERVDYLVDTAGLSQVVAELNAAGAVTALHVRGGDLLATLRPSAAPSDPEIAPWVARYFHAEGIGSIRALTDASGVVANRYAFEAFGNLSSSTGEQRNSYLFAAEALDLASGLQYHRARWLQPGLGRFASVDPWPGRPTGPLSLHRYMYASVDPLSQVDPSGAFSVLALGVALAVVGIVAQIGISWLGSGVGDIPVRLRPVIVNGSRWSASEVQAQLEASRSYFARQGTGIVLSWEPVMKDDELVERYATPHFPDDLGTLVQLYNGGDAFPLVFVDRFREPNDPLGRRTGGAKWPPQPWAEVGQRCTGRRGAVITRWAGLLSPATTPHELAHVIGCIGHSEDRLNLMRGDGNPGSQLNERQVRWLRKGAKNKPW